jgi:hypothetical protein
MRPQSLCRNVVVKAIIVPELELCNVKMQVFLTNMMEWATMPRLKMLQKPSMVWAVMTECSGFLNLPQFWGLRQGESGFATLTFRAFALEKICAIHAIDMVAGAIT